MHGRVGRTFLEQKIRTSYVAWVCHSKSIFHVGAASIFSPSRKKALTRLLGESEKNFTGRYGLSQERGEERFRHLAGQIIRRDPVI